MGDALKALAGVRQRFRKAAIGIVAVATLSLAFACTLPAGLVREGAVHPLQGRIWDVARGRMVSKEALLQDVASARIILLGEIHDNPEHHRLQAEVLRSVLAQGRRPALAMEQFDREFQPALDAAAAKPGVSADALASAGGFNRDGWPWAMYEPLLATAIEARLPVVALNLSRDGTRAVARQGFDSLGAGAVRTLALDATWNAARQAVMDREISDGHCGKLPPSALPRMINVQRARDAVMADALLGGQGDGAVVIAGNGHVRNDVGVPVYLASRAPAQRVVSIGFIEVHPGENAVNDYVRPPATALPYDYAWFTSAAKREDPCAGLVIPERK